MKHKVNQKQCQTLIILVQAMKIWYAPVGAAINRICGPKWPWATMRVIPSFRLRTRLQSASCTSGRVSTAAAGRKSAAAGFVVAKSSLAPAQSTDATMPLWKLHVRLLNRTPKSAPCNAIPYLVSEPGKASMTIPSQRNAAMAFLLGKACIWFSDGGPADNT